MKPLSVDFARRRPWRLWMVYGLALVALGASGLQVRSALQLENASRAIEEQVAALRAQLRQQADSVEAAKAPVEAEPPYRQDATLIERAASYDIGKVLTALESAQVAGVNVMAVEVVPSERRAKVDLEVKDAQALLAYIEALNAGQPSQQNWKLLRAQSPSTTSPGSATLVAPTEFGGSR